jgi:hypothetical protein
VKIAQTLVPEPSASEVQMGIEKPRRPKLPGRPIDQIPTELVKAGGRTFRSDIHKLIISVCNKEELPEQGKESIIVFVYKEGDKTDCINYRQV